MLLPLLQSICIFDILARSKVCRKCIHTQSFIIFGFKQKTELSVVLQEGKATKHFGGGTFREKQSKNE